MFLIGSMAHKAENNYYHYQALSEKVGWLLLYTLQKSLLKQFLPLVT